MEMGTHWRGAWLALLVSASCAWGEGPTVYEVEGSAQAKGTQVVDLPNASAGKVLKLLDRDSSATVSVAVSPGEHTLVISGCGPAPDQDSVYVEAGPQEKRRIVFPAGVAEQSVSFFAVRAGSIAVTFTTDEPGVCVDCVTVREGAKAQAFEVADLVEKPSERDWLTRLLVRFDEAGNVDPVHARGIPHGGANNTTFEPKGKFGGAIGFYNRKDPYGSIIAAHSVEQAEKCVLFYPGGSNLPVRQGTIEFWVRNRDGANLWNDSRQHDMLHVVPSNPLPDEAPGFRMDLVKCGDNSLRLRVGENSIGLDVEGLAAEAWHHVACSWDVLSSPARIWLAVDGKGVTVPCAAPLNAHSFLVLFLGNTMDYERNYPLEAAVDDLKVSEWTLGERTSEGLAQRGATAVDGPLAMQAEDGLRRWFGIVNEISMRGGWSMMYQWPTRIPLNSGLIQDPTDPRVDIMKYGTPLRYAKECWRAYEIFGDYCFEETARLLTDRLMCEQDPRGFWGCEYLITPSGPVGHPDYARIQDDYQTVPMNFLVYAYRVTGDKRYLEAARKSADFLVAAQNPNGSWSDGFYVNEGKGYTAEQHDHAGGGSFNDGATTDPFFKLLLMYHVTQDEKYLKPLIRAADWTISAEIKGKARGWAQQYKADNTPAWARRHEPPAICAREFPDSVAPILFATYLLTGDKKYPDALRGTLRWLQEVKVPRSKINAYYLKDEPPDKPFWSFYYDPATGKGCYSVRRFGEMYEHHLDETQDAPPPIGFYKWENYAVDRVAETLAKIDKGEYKAPVGSLDLPEAAIAAKRQSASRWCGGDAQRRKVLDCLKEQGQDGAWTGHTPGFGTSLEDRSGVLLEYLTQARMAVGKFPARFLMRGAYDGRITDGAWFSANWYDTPLKKAQ